MFGNFFSKIKYTDNRVKVSRSKIGRIFDKVKMLIDNYNLVVIATIGIVSGLLVVLGVRFFNMSNEVAFQTWITVLATSTASVILSNNRSR